MNIKLDSDVRIRLDEEDAVNWKSCQHLEQTFNFGSLVLQVRICFDTTASMSYVHSEGQKLVVCLTANACESLFSRSNHKGITVGEIALQFDRWNKDKRTLHQKIRSRDKSI